MFISTIQGQQVGDIALWGLKASYLKCQQVLKFKGDIFKQIK